jgi:hypothetical protein
MKNGIVPLRIGKEDAIDESISMFQIDRRKEALKKKMKTSLHDLNLKDEKEIDEFLTQITVMSSNLVCGTIIGILQYPQFKNNKQSGYVTPEFDYLIIDESSKTTVQQFLVPAINAKKWIIAGDIKQLSPYLESLHIRVSIENMIGKHIETALLLYFVFIFEQSNQRVKEGKLPKYVLPLDNQVIVEFIRIISENIELAKSTNFIKKDIQTALEGLNIGIVSSEPIEIPRNLISNITQIDNGSINDDYSRIYKLMTSDLLLISLIDFESVKPFIPTTHLILSNELSDLITQHLYRHEKWYKENNTPYFLKLGFYQQKNYEKIRDHLYDSLTKNWAGQLSWRLARVYELEDVSENSKAKKYYVSSMHALIPQGNNHNRIFNEIKRMGQIFFPSILKCMQTGINGEYQIETNKTVISNGMPSDAFSQRHVLLTYQHRMHDEIADIPRKLFYNKTNGKAIKALITSNAMEKDREFEISHPIPDLHNKRLAWINVNANDFRNRNDKEADRIIDYIKIIRNWVVKQENNREWILAVITYYNKQKEVVANKIKKTFKEVNQAAKTNFSIGKLKVIVYTVDKIQGREADIVFISMVRNSKLGFMDSPNRLNVGITRAKYLQIIFGNVDFFNNSDSYELRQVVRHLTSNESLFKIGNNKKLEPYQIEQNQKPRGTNRRQSKNRRRYYFGKNTSKSKY